MDREIKFRGQRIGNNEWVYGYYVKDPKGQIRIYYQPFEAASSNTYFFVRTDSIGEYTGLKDKNGVEIYEGDILNVGEGVCVIEWDMVSWNPKVIIKDNSYMLNNYFPSWYFHNQISKVIGNIHQHPELLTKQL